MAGVPNHAFWNGIENDLRTHAHREVLLATGPHFLTRRFRNASSFLDPNELPSILHKDLFYPFRWDEGIKEKARETSLSDLAEKYPDSFAITFWTGSWL